LKKRAFLVILIISFFLSIFSLKPKAKAETIKVWVGAITAEKEAMEEIGTSFYNETGIKVEVIQKLEIFTVPDALANNAKLTTKPDLVYMQAPDIGGLVKSGFLEPLDLGEDVISRYNDVAVEAFSLDGKVYGLGYTNSAYGIIYNKDIISEENLPETWDDYFQMAEDLTIRENESILRRGAYFNVTDMWFNYPIISHYGGYYYGMKDGTYNPFDIGLDNEGMLDYVNKMKEMQELGLVIDNREKRDYSPIISDFADGKVAMFLYGLWSAAIFQDRGINYGIAPLPYSGDERSRPLSTVEGFVINKYSDDLEATRQFFDYIYLDKNQQKLIEAGNLHNKKTGERNPCNLSVLNSDYIQSDEILRSISEIGKHVEPFPNIPEGTLWYNQNVTAVTFATVFFGDSYNNEVDAAFKLRELADYLRSEVNKMNEGITEAALSWEIYLIIGLAVLSIIISFLIIYILKKIRTPKHLKPISNKRDTIFGYIFILPFIMLVGLFYIYPIIQNFYLSMTNYSGTTLLDYNFIGFANYKTIFTTELSGFLGMSAWTVSFAFLVTGASFVFGTLLATILSTTNAHVSRVYRVIYILPWVIPTAITLLMWQGLLETQGGLINQILGVFNIKNIPWLTKPWLAKFSTIFVMTWFSFPYYMVIAFGFLKSISKDYYEAAEMDGASKSQMFFKITLPLTFRALSPMLIMGFLMQFNQFGVYLLTQGGPASDVIGAPGATDLLVTYIFNTSFNTKRYGLAASYAVIVFAIMALFSLAVMAVSKKRQGD
jgi:arabinogalactan oligomer/maltooligosaccharide transport system permease protein